jgi:hypothetical protein
MPSFMFVITCCVQKRLIWSYAAFLWFDSLMMVPCEPRHVGIFGVMLYYKYLRNKFVHFVGLGHELRMLSLGTSDQRQGLHTFIAYPLSTINCLKSLLSFFAHLHRSNLPVVHAMPNLHTVFKLLENIFNLCRIFTCILSEK